MAIYLMILGMALVTYLPRLLPGVFVSRLRFGPKTTKFLKLIPYTAIAALIFPGVLKTDPNYWIIGALGITAAIILAWRKFSIGTVVVGAVAVDVLLYLIIG